MTKVINSGKYNFDIVVGKLFSLSKSKKMY